MASSSRRSASKSASNTGSDGYIARASASGMSGLSRSCAAASFIATMRCACSIEAMTTRGALCGADSRRSIRSVESRRSHTDRYRRLESTLMMVPLDKPAAGRTAAVLAKRKVEARAAEAAASPGQAIGQARRAGDAPARGGRARHRTRLGVARWRIRRPRPETRALTPSRAASDSLRVAVRSASAPSPVSSAMTQASARQRSPSSIAQSTSAGRETLRTRRRAGESPNRSRPGP